MYSLCDEFKILAGQLHSINFVIKKFPKQWRGTCRILAQPELTNKRELHCNYYYLLPFNPSLGKSFYLKTAFRVGWCIPCCLWTEGVFHSQLRTILISTGHNFVLRSVQSLIYAKNMKILLKHNTLSWRSKKLVYLNTLNVWWCNLKLRDLL